MALVGLSAACGDDSRPEQRDPFAYDHARPLRPKAVKAQRLDAVSVERVTYSAADGERVPALLAVPRDERARGCLIYQGGLGTKKENAAYIWSGAAALGLATFTVDTRFPGPRASRARPPARALRDPDRLAARLRDSVIDLRRGLDYLERRPECQRNVGYLGISLGAILGAALAANDERVHAAVLMAVGATWHERLLYSGGAALPGVRERPRELETALRKLRPFETARWVAEIAPRPVMLVNGRRDPRVPVVDGLNLAAAARDPKTVFFHDGGHDPLAPPHRDEVTSRVARFLLTELAEYRSG